MGRRLAIAVAFVAMAVVSTWPLAAQLHCGIPKASGSSSTVPILNLWTVEWNLNRAFHGWKGYWDAPHFYPSQKSLALSEPLMTSQSMAVLGWLPPVVAYNVFLLSALALNGGITWLALIRRRVQWPVALLASFAMVRLPFVHSQLGVLQCVLVAGVIGTIHFVAEAIATRRSFCFWLAAACFDLTYLTCGYYGLFLAALLPVCVAVSFWRRVGWGESSRPTIKPIAVGGSRSSTRPMGVATATRSPHASWTLGIAGAIAILVLLVPIIRLQSQVLSDPQYDRPRELIRELSALPSDYLATPFPELFRFVGLSHGPEAGRWGLSPGLFKSLLAIFGIAVGIRSRPRRAWTLRWMAIAGCAFVGSLGLNLSILGWQPYLTLLDWFPDLSRLRTPARMAVIVQIGIIFLAAESLHWGFRQARRIAHRNQARPWKRWPCALVWTCGLVASVEVSLPRPAFIDVPSAQTQSGWIDWLKANTSPEAVIAHIPLPSGPFAKDYESEAWAMYWGLFHHRRMVNGYSGFFPLGYLELKSQMQKFPEKDSFDALRSRGVSHCVVQQPFLNQLQLKGSFQLEEQWSLRFKDSAARVAIYELKPSVEPGSKDHP